MCTIACRTNTLWIALQGIPLRLPFFPEGGAPLFFALRDGIGGNGPHRNVLPQRRGAEAVRDGRSGRQQQRLNSRRLLVIALRAPHRQQPRGSLWRKHEGAHRRQVRSEDANGLVQRQGVIALIMITHLRHCAPSPCTSSYCRTRHPHFCERSSRCGQKNRLAERHKTSERDQRHPFRSCCRLSAEGRRHGSIDIGIGGSHSGQKGTDNIAGKMGP